MRDRWSDDARAARSGLWVDNEPVPPVSTTFGAGGLSGWFTWTVARRDFDLSQFEGDTSCMATLHRRAVILTALPIERTAVLEHLRDVREEPHPRGSVYRRATFDDNSEPWDILLAEIGVGNEGAAAEVERTIAHFSPQVALFIGIAGGIKDLARGDVVASTKVYNYCSGKDRTSHFETRPETELPAYSLRERARYEAAEPDWRQRIRASEQAAVPTAAPSAKVGPITAGPKVLASIRSATYKFVRKHYGDALAVEMEGHGFLLGVHMNQPVEGIVVRGISDCIDDKTPDRDLD
jgi:nucleoside phosphorylase